MLYLIIKFNYYSHNFTETMLRCGPVFGTFHILSYDELLQIYN